MGYLMEVNIEQDVNWHTTSRGHRSPVPSGPKTIEVIFCEGTRISKTGGSDFWVIFPGDWVDYDHNKDRFNSLKGKSIFVKTEDLFNYLSEDEKEELIFNLEQIIEL